ncbi:uncharacterized protein B0H18DRAFT_1208798 [Fomitopsis serialis]|uniref:uncharacterized protein n=1 Tax=Fomitopsis serialis TaxID=139415 RepID=UPI0020079BBE|nr:uncharacterized protein B0H18DRAFT_1208798 [Neoantrodia serialis]KAH9931439.1 hypothetical protein B0H18DRAFT_1208798 [Neoantrodia serialis]
MSSPVPIVSESTSSSCDLGRHNDLLAEDDASAVPRVLFNEDLLDNIVGFLHHSQYTDDPVSVARLARTSRRLQYTATRALWATLDSLVPLLKLIPGLTWNQHREEGGTVRWDVAEAATTPPDALALNTTRFECYSSLVKTFIWTDQDLAAEAFFFFLNALSEFGKPWLPAVRKFKDQSRDYLPPLVVFGAPTLQSLLVNGFITKEESLLDLLEELPERCAGLQQIHLMCTTDAMWSSVNSDFYPNVTTFLVRGIDGASLMGLRHLRTIVPIGWEGMSCLAHMPQLEQLEMFLFDLDFDGLDVQLLPANPFPSLTRVWLHMLELDDGFVELIDNIHSVHLNILQIQIAHKAPDVATTRKFFESVARSAFSRNLTKLCFLVQSTTQTEANPQSLQPPTSSIHTLQPLLLLDLEVLSIEVPRIFLYSEDIDDMAAAWPRLQGIKIRQTWHIVAPVEVHALLAFADCCYLEEIDFDVGMDDVPYELDHHPRPLTSVRYQSCRIVCRTKATYYYCVAYLDRLYPYATTQEALDKLWEYFDQLDSAQADEHSSSLVAGPSDDGYFEIFVPD